MNNRIRYNADEHQRHTFYQTPKFLFTGEFKSLNNDARMTYSLLRDRHDLSLKNHWVDEKNDIYLIFSRDEMCELLGVSENTILKSMKALKKVNLIEEERQGLGRPNKIYLLTVENLINPQTRKICGSGTANSADLDPQNLRPNDTDLKDIDLNETEGERKGQPPPHRDAQLKNFNKGKEPPAIPARPSEGLTESSPIPNKSNQVNYNYNRLDQNSQEPAENVSQSTYGRFSKVKLTAAEYADLLKEFGEKKVLDYIGRLDEHIASTGKMYPSHFATIIKWIDQDDRKLSSNRPVYKYKNRFINYSQREWDYDKIEQLAQQEMMQGIKEYEGTGVPVLRVK